MIEAMIRAWSIPELRKRISFVLGMMAVFAVGAHIPVPGIDHSVIQNMLRNGGGGILQLIDAFGGGALRRMSIFAMGIGPYINASIIMQMMTIALPQLDALSKEGESGRKQIAKITRNLTVLLAFVQAMGIILMFGQNGAHLSLFSRLEICVVLTAGSSFLLWIGEQVTQKGVGNGISLVIFAGILLSLPTQGSLVLAQVKAGTPWFNVIILIAAFVATVWFIIMITQGTRRIPIQHTKRVIGRSQTAGGASYFPIKVNSAGVIPIIFAISLMLFPATIVNAIPSKTPFFLKAKEFLLQLNPGQNIPSTLFYALLVIVFTYFYTAIVMNVQEIADN
ncbi:MAG: Protein translocase subunit SecY, partial [Chthonomonadales bacterium]|nr:Protein translocase subunit SecY [Chthonomonadales bacterium]